MKSQRIKAILNDRDFLGMVKTKEAMLTKKVMSKSTSDDDRQQALAEYHALSSLMASMRSEALNAETKE